MATNKAEITWANCADEMPPDDKTRIILRIYNGIIVDHGQWFTRYKSTLIKANAVWLRYTTEKWKELNK